MTPEMTEDRRMLVDSLQSWLHKEYTLEHWRAIARGDRQRADRVWAQFAEMGWLAAALPEDCDGLGGGAVEQGLIARELGSALVLEPYLSTVVVGAGLIALMGSQAQRQQWLPCVATGELRLAFAGTEQDSRYALERVAMRAVRSGSSYKLSGRKVSVWDAPQADKLIVLARTGGAPGDRAGLGLFLVDAKAPGLHSTEFPMLDQRRGAHLDFDNVPVLDVLGDPEGALPAVEQVLDQALACLAHEACGAMRAVTEQTIDYIKQRKQFGQALAEFQVLRHRVVDMTVAAQQAQALAAHATASLALDARKRALVASAAKVQAGRSGLYVGQQAIQLHGGMGMTDALAIGHYFKRLTMIDMAYGNADHHQGRYARLSRSAALA